jgi:hypothetical protein
MHACGQNTVLVPAPLIQIRRRYVAQLGHIQLRVENDTNCWVAEVVEDGRTLYAARRCSAAAAKAVATEFTAFKTTPARDGVRQELRWAQCW